MPIISGVPVAELLRYENPDATRLAGLIKDSIIDFIIESDLIFILYVKRYFPGCYFVFSFVSLCGKRIFNH
jgi:hypothetical protein